MQTLKERIDTMKGLYKIPEFLRDYPMSRATLYREAAAGRLRLTKIGRATRIAKSDALAWAASLPKSGGAQA